MNSVEVPGRVTTQFQARLSPDAAGDQGALADPEFVDAVVTAPSGTQTTYTRGVDAALVRDSLGTFSLSWIVVEAGHWYVRWVGSGGGPNVVAEEEFWASDNLTGGPIVTPASAVSWRPSVADVADLVPMRTADPAGIPQGTFTADTLPTAAQVENLIAQVIGQVGQAIGDMPARLATPALPTGSPGTSAAGHCVALGAAAYVESTFYPDQQIGANSSADRLYAWYRDALKGLRTAKDDATTTGDIGGPVMPQWSFPDTVARGLATTHWTRW